MHAIVELTPLTLRGGDILHQLESKTGRLPFKTIELPERRLTTWSAQ